MMLPEGVPDRDRAGGDGGVDRWFCADLIYIIAALDLPHRVGVAETPNYYAGPHFLVTVGSFRFVVPDPGTGDGLG